MRFLALAAIVLVLAAVAPFSLAQDLDSLPPQIHVLEKGQTTLYLIGTLHAAHSRNPHYSWPHLEKIFTLVSPQLVLVEIRPEHFTAEEFYSDGPLEMGYFVYLAEKSGARCAGMDYWLDAWLRDYSNVTYVIQEIREDSMATRILVAIDEFKPSKVLVATGNGHSAGFVSRLIRAGYVQREKPVWELSTLSYQDVPDPVLELWNRGAEYLSHLPASSTERMKSKIDTWRMIVQHRGYLFERKDK